MSKLTISILLLALSTVVGLAQSDKPLLLRKPAISQTQIAFSYAGDLWVVGRDGGDAKRLTAGIGVETDPVFSPDGTQIAFTGEYDGNIDVYIIPVTGGIPRRLTFHPGADTALGWTPDGKQILFRSPRNSYSGFNQLFTVPAQGGGGFPNELPLPIGEEASFSPDGSKVAYVPHPQWQKAWKRYRGGQTTPIWIANLADSSVEAIPRDNSNDSNPMWIGHTIYFLSDRSGPVTLFAYDTATKNVKQVLKNDGLDLKSAAASPGAIVYEQFGSVHVLDIASGEAKRIEIRVAGDLPQVRPHFQKVEASGLGKAGLSPTGIRAVFEARGEILTVPAEKGDVRNITNTPGVAERDPAWSPDGKWIAYFSDESGEYALHLREQNGMGEVRKINLGSPPSYFYSPFWSPDSKKITYTDKRLNLWYVDVDKGKPVRIDTDRFDTPFHTIDPVWSPDNRWVAYTKQLRSHLHAVFVYSLEQNKSYQLTDGMSDARFPAFDKNGKYLYFTSSTDIGLAASWLDMSGFNHPVTRSVYLMVLRKDLPSPLAPESDEEKLAQQKASADAAKPSEGEVADKNKADDKTQNKPPEAMRIDLDNISQRILALPIPARNYQKLAAGKEGVLFLGEAPPIDSVAGGEPSLIVQKFDLGTRKTEKALEGIKFFDLAANGEKMLYQQGEQWFIVPTAQPAKPGEGALKLEGMEVYIDPRAEWKQIYHEIWRIQRDFFYDPGFHGLDLKATEKKYEPYLENIASRDDLNYLFEEMLGELTVGHMFVGGGDEPEVKKVKGGLLGADYKIDNGRYRFARVYNGENWSPQLRAPLTQPGVNVVAGEYLLSVQGKELTANEDLYKAFEGTADKSVVMRVGPRPDGSGSREVTVVPVASETGLRNLSWIEDNRRKVDQMSGGRVAYIYLPNTAGGGYTNFNRYYFAQVGKEAAIIDERFNGGGALADYIIDYLRRPMMSLATTREGEDFTSPGGSIYGPKVMIINEMAGSGGDAMPWYFRKANIGPLVGKKTWGGLVGIYDYPTLIDGGYVTAPRAAIYGLKGDWEVENRGISPDVDVELDPHQMTQGHDPQLERAVEVVMDLLRKNPLPAHARPPYPNYHPVAAQTGQAGNTSQR